MSRTTHLSYLPTEFEDQLYASMQVKSNIRPHSSLRTSRRCLDDIRHVFNVPLSTTPHVQPTKPTDLKLNLHSPNEDIYRPILTTQPQPMGALVPNTPSSASISLSFGSSARRISVSTTASSTILESSIGTGRSETSGKPIRAINTDTHRKQDSFSQYHACSYHLGAWKSTSNLDENQASPQVNPIPSNPVPSPLERKGSRSSLVSRLRSMDSSLPAGLNQSFMDSGRTPSSQNTKPSRHSSGEQPSQRMTQLPPGPDRRNLMLKLRLNLPKVPAESPMHYAVDEMSASTNVTQGLERYLSTPPMRESSSSDQTASSSQKPIVPIRSASSPFAFSDPDFSESASTPSKLQHFNANHSHMQLGIRRHNSRPRLGSSEGVPAGPSALGRIRRQSSTTTSRSSSRSGSFNTLQ